MATGRKKHPCLRAHVNRGARETRRHAAHREHHQLVDLVEQRDLESFEKLMRKHIERSKETCLLALEESKLKQNEAQK